MTNLRSWPSARGGYVDSVILIRPGCVRLLRGLGGGLDEVLRVLDALQTDELCPCNWKSGDETLVVRELLNA